MRNNLKQLSLLLSYSLYGALLPLFPWIMRQGKRVKASTLRLPEAAGPFCVDKNTPAADLPALLHIGESTVAGVGVEHLQDGFSAAVYRATDIFGDCHILGRNGWKAGDFIQSGLLTEQCLPADAVLLITLGVNDTTGFTSLRRWQQNIRALVQQTPPARAVFFTQVPAMQQFPALPAPLNWLLGLRAWQLDKALQILCAQQGWHHLPSTLKIPPQWMAADGYHPNAVGYDQWGQQTAAAIGHILKLRHKGR